MSDGVINPDQKGGVLVAYTVVNTLVSLIFFGLLIWLLVWLVKQ